MTGSSGDASCDPSWFQLGTPADSAFIECCKNVPTEPPIITTTIIPSTSTEMTRSTHASTDTIVPPERR